MFRDIIEFVAQAVVHRQNPALRRVERRFVRGSGVQHRRILRRHISRGGVSPDPLELIILGLASLVIALRPDPEPAWPALGRLVEIGAAVVVMILYAQLLPVVGFIIATACAAAYLSWRLGSSILGSLMTGVGTSVGIYVIFHLVLGLSLARGPFGF